VVSCPVVQYAVSVSLDGRFVDFAEDVVEGFGDVPAGVVDFHLGQVADVADVVASAVLVHVFVLHFFAAAGGGTVEGFKDGDAVGAATTEVVNFAAAGVFIKSMDEAGDVEGVDVVAHLLAFVAEHLVETALDVAFDEVAEEAVEFHTAMVGAGEAATAQAAGFHAEIAAVLLDHDIAGDLGGAEEAVFALVYGKILGDAIEVGRVIIIPAGGEFLEGDGVRTVAVHFVGAQVGEHDLGHMAAGGFKEIQGANGVDIEIIKGAGGSEVMAGLGRRMHQQSRAERGQETVNAGAVADVEFVMVEPGMGGLEAALVPAGVTAGAEEIGAGVVVNAMNFPASLAEIVHNFRADEAG
jgi:hypothetical protein